MAKRVKRSRQSRRAGRLEFAAIEIVGALLPPEIVTRIAAFELPEQSEEGYGSPLGLKLRDEIARYYQIATAHWERFSTLRHGSPNASQQFVLEVLKGCFGFAEIRETAPAEFAGRRFPIGRSSHNGTVPIVIAPSAATESRKAGVDEALAEFGDGSRRRSATQLLQEYLNAEDRALWGIASDGSTLRLMRDNVSLTRPAWIEADLEKIFAEGLFADFSALWLLLHASCFGSGGGSPSDCPLEQWRERAQLDGTAAREKLRLGFEAALRELGSGFLEDRENGKLREALHSGEVSRQGFYEDLLRLVYRLIFLFAAEDRGLLHAPNAQEAARRAYQRGYSVARLRERCVKSSALERHHDAWGGLKASFEALARGEPRLGLGALGGLFTPSNLELLTHSQISNRRLLKAVWHLTWFRPEGQPLTRVNWRDMQTEELGSVYESLLEFIPVVHLETRSFTFAIAASTGKGSERKTTGSYYTPDSLVQLLLTNTLDAVLDAAELRNPADPAAEILKLSIIDPACGSGHFLLAAARRAAGRISRHRSSGTPSQEAFQHALREVVSNCIYGVDRNPMAVELCKVALWIEALEPGKPLSFLDARIRCGDSLIGVFDYEMLRRGLPDEAFDELTGDDKKVAKYFRQKNARERDGAGSSSLFAEFRAPAEIRDGADRVLALPEDTLDEITAKSRAWEHFLQDPKREALKSACDMYVAAFLLPKTTSEAHASEEDRSSVPTTDDIWTAVRSTLVHSRTEAISSEITTSNRGFHWPLEFPAVLARGGFDAVVGNPPWEVSQLNEQEFFTVRDEQIALLQGSQRKGAIRELKDSNPHLWEEFRLASRAVEAANSFFRASGRFPLTASGKINSYPLFAEHFDRLVKAPSSSKVTTGRDTSERSREGRAGIIVPTGIATDNSTSGFFSSLVAGERLTALYDFENRERLFPAVDSRVRFSILAIGPSQRANFAAFLTDSKLLQEKERRIELGAADFRLMNPNTLTVPLFRARADSDLTEKLYRTAPVLVERRAGHPEGDKNPWGIVFQQGLYNMTSASGSFRTAPQLSRDGFERDGSNWSHDDGRIFVPLFESKMIHHFDHRYGSYAGLDGRPGDGSLPETDDEQKAAADYEAEPWYWVPEDETCLRVARVPARLKQHLRRDNGEGCLKVLAEWVASSLEPEDLLPRRLTQAVPLVEARLREVLGVRAAQRSTLGASLPSWLSRVAGNARRMRRETPLIHDDLEFIKEATREPLELTEELVKRKQPRWLLGWRDITNATNERTVIGCAMPVQGIGNNLPIWHPRYELGAGMIGILVGLLSSIALDYCARQKVAGTHLNFFYAEQLPVLNPEAFSPCDQQFIGARVLELTYTSHSMRAWAEDFGYSGSPFGFNSDRRAKLRAELDAFFARKYGLNRDELRYILDPADTHGEYYPSETFRGLKRNEVGRYGEYRTQRLVLEAYDRLAGV